jgi:peptidoglycan/LPS O-acetylase OafA/YrhL
MNHHQSQKDGYLGSLHALNGLGAMIIALYHFHAQIFPGFDLNTIHSVFPLPDPIWGWFAHTIVNGGWLVQLFFCLSGFLMCYHYKTKIEQGRITFADFSVARLSRIYPAHWVVMIAAAPIMIGVAKLSGVIGFETVVAGHGNNANVLNFIYTFTLVNTVGLNVAAFFNPSTWYLTFIILLYTMFFVIIKHCKGRSGLLYFAVPVAVGTSIINGAFADFSTVPLISETGGFAMVSFFMGCAVCELYKRRDNVNFRLPALIVSVAVVLLFPYLLRYHPSYLETSTLRLTSTAYTIAFYPALIFVCLHIKWLSKFLSMSFFQWLGDLSFSIYLWHLPVLFLAGLLLAVFDKQAYASSRIVLISWFTATVALAQITHLFIEKPAQKYIRNTYNKWKAAKETA